MPFDSGAMLTLTRSALWSSLPMMPNIEHRRAGELHREVEREHRVGDLLDRVVGVVDARLRLRVDLALPLCIGGIIAQLSFICTSGPTTGMSDSAAGLWPRP